MDEKDRKHIFDNPRNVKLLIRALFAACGISLLAEVFVHRHAEHPWEGMYGFYCLYGFAACVALVLIAKELRKILMRSEDYYDE